MLSLFSRYEWVQKPSDELSLNESIYGKDEIFPVNALTVGFNYNLVQIKKTVFAIGSHVTFSSADKKLNNLYGDNPLSLEVYLRIYPALMKMNMK